MTEREKVRKIRCDFDILYHKLRTLSAEISNKTIDNKIEFWITETKGLVDCGEEFVGFENICANLSGGELPLTSEILSIVTRIGKEINCDHSVWHGLAELVDPNRVKSTLTEDVRVCKGEYSDPFERYNKMKIDGCSPEDAYDMAKSNGLSNFLAVKMLRAVFDLSLHEANRITRPR